MKMGIGFLIPNRHKQKSHSRYKLREKNPVLIEKGTKLTSLGVISSILTSYRLIQRLNDFDRYSSSFDWRSFPVFVRLGAVQFVLSIYYDTYHVRVQFE